MLCKKIIVKGGGYSVPELSKVDMQKLYHGYIHNSLKYDDLANGGTILSKSKTANGAYDYSHPIRPQVTKGFR